jgi:hypothetical protein
MEFQKILPSDESIVMFAKIAVNQGRSPGLEKNEFYDAIVKRAGALRADGESQQQTFSKVITEDETGRLLYKAMQIAPGSEVKPAPQEPAKEPAFIGPAPQPYSPQGAPDLSLRANSRSQDACTFESRPPRTKAADSRAGDRRLANEAAHAQGHDDFRAC